MPMRFSIFINLSLLWGGYCPPNPEGVSKGEKKSDVRFEAHFLKGVVEAPLNFIFTTLL